MAPIPYFVAFAGVALSALLVTTVGPLKSFHRGATALNQWDSAVLATSRVAAKESNNLLNSLSGSYNNAMQASYWKCLIPTPAGPKEIKFLNGIPGTYPWGGANKAVINSSKFAQTFCLPGTLEHKIPFAGLAKTVSSMRTGQYTIKMGMALSSGSAKGKSVAVGNIAKTLRFGVENVPSRRDSAYKMMLINSSYIPDKYHSNRKSTDKASTLINPEKKKFRKLGLKGLDKRYISGSRVKISDRTLRKLVPNYYADIMSDGKYSGQMGVRVNEGNKGVDFRNLANGIALTIFNNPKGKQLLNSEKLLKVGTAQLRYRDKTKVRSPGKPKVPEAKYCKDEEGRKRKVEYTEGRCYDFPYAEGCACGNNGFFSRKKDKATKKQKASDLISKFNFDELFKNKYIKHGESMIKRKERSREERDLKDLRKLRKKYSDEYKNSPRSKEEIEDYIKDLQKDD